MKALKLLGWLLVLALLALAIRVARADQPVNVEPVRERCDLNELNTFYNESGNINFVQALYLDWDYRNGVWDYYVRDYRIVRSGDHWPQRDWTGGGGYVSRWHDAGLMREMRAPAFRQTDTQFDPEVEQRDRHPVEQRAKLLTPR